MIWNWLILSYIQRLSYRDIISWLILKAKNELVSNQFGTVSWLKTEEFNKHAKNWKFILSDAKSPTNKIKWINLAASKLMRDITCLIRMFSSHTSLLKKLVCEKKNLMNWTRKLCSKGNLKNVEGLIAGPNVRSL